ncbi:MAG: uncharacterized protein KVP18_001177 [Porospora cf. gigantea A]|nr:MAG: hypothetical protein KVP18_001177 [Porospora cf. gigantea A]
MIDCLDQAKSAPYVESLVVGCTSSGDSLRETILSNLSIDASLCDVLPYDPLNPKNHPYSVCFEISQRCDNCQTVTRQTEIQPTITGSFHRYQNDTAQQCVDRKFRGPKGVGKSVVTTIACPCGHDRGVSECVEVDVPPALFINAACSTSTVSHEVTLTNNIQVGHLTYNLSAVILASDKKRHFTVAIKKREGWYYIDGHVVRFTGERPFVPMSFKVYAGLYSRADGLPIRTAMTRRDLCRVPRSRRPFVAPPPPPRAATTLP